MNDLEKKLKEKLTELRKPGISLQKANDLYFEAKEIANNANEEDITKKALILMAHGIQEVYKKGVIFFQKWQTEKIEPTDHELYLFSKMVDELLEVIPKLADDELLDEYKTQYKDFDNFFSVVIKAKVIVEAEKTRRRQKNQTSLSTDNEKELETNKVKSGTQQEKTTSQQNEEIQELNKEAESLTQQLFELQKQTGELLELLKKKENSNDQQTTKQEIQQRLVKVQSQQQQVQKQLELKKQVLQVEQQKVKELENKQHSNEGTSDEGWVVFPIGGVIILLLGIVIFQNQKKKQSK